mmetsp:Transcript_8680/g.36176  ORF Transcript_8680/g.36176 Transcript_8680/m.36176 type:complete len:200 (+) Transcript_8680:246-845(+)
MRMLFWVAAHSQNLLGLNARAWMMPPAWRVARCLLSLRSQSMATWSLPPEAHRDPSGATVTQLMYPVCPTKVVLSLQSLRFHTLTCLSQPPETTRGLATLGEKRTQLTHSLWAPAPDPSPSMVCLHSPRVFQSFRVLSREPETIWRLSEEKATLSASFLWPQKVRVDTPRLRSHKRRVVSHEQERANWPSEDSTTSSTK